MQRSLAAFSVTMNQIVAVLSMPPIPHGSPWVLNITKPCSVLSTWFWMRAGKGQTGEIVGLPHVCFGRLGCRHVVDYFCFFAEVGVCSECHIVFTFVM